MESSPRRRQNVHLNREIFDFCEFILFEVQATKEQGRTRRYKCVYGNGMDRNRKNLSSYNQSLELLTSQSESSELFYLGYFSLS